MAERPGYDLVIQATAGVMSITGEPGGMPMKIGVAITDVLTGLYAVTSALAGLYSRGRGRGGAAFDLALADCTLASLVNVAQGALVTGDRPRRYGNAHPHIVPYEAFATADGHLVLAVGNDRQFARFCHAVDRDEWAEDERFRTNPLRVGNREALIPLIADLIGQRTTARWQDLLTAADVPHAPVTALDEILSSPQVAAREMVHDVTDAEGRRYKLLGNPIHYAGRGKQTPQPPPAVGQHSQEVLKEWLDYDAERIAELCDADGPVT
jgi:crotonobetainyl-CoA:carnitine CoA-transferase CaiB-like acyl-CoA transferase